MTAAPAPPPPPPARTARRLGLFGGSFDPPHVGHLHALRAARRGFDLDHVVLVPAARPPHKPERDLTPGAERVHMLELLLEDEPDTSIWTVELERGGPSYTIDTVREMRSWLAPRSELFWILGSDNLAGLPSWHRAEELLELCRPIVVLRRGASLEPPAGLTPEARERIAAGFVEEEPEDASSSELRRALAADGIDSVELPPRLREYIVERGFYSS